MLPHQRMPSSIVYKFHSSIGRGALTDDESRQRILAVVETARAAGIQALGDQLSWISTLKVVEACHKDVKRHKLSANSGLEQTFQMMLRLICDVRHSEQ